MVDPATFDRACPTIAINETDVSQGRFLVYTPTTPAYQGTQQAPRCRLPERRMLHLLDLSPIPRSTPPKITLDDC